MAEVLAAAFAEEAYLTAMLGSGPDTAARARHLLGLQLRHQYLPHGVVDLAIVDDQIAGVGLWSPPGGSAGSLWAQARLVPQYLRLTGRRFAQAVLAELASARAHPRFAHWYLYMLGASPDHRGLGVGGRLLAHRLGQLADDEPAYLEASSPASARLYARHGFVTMGRVPVDGRSWLEAMWRPPARTMEQ